MWDSRKREVRYDDGKGKRELVDAIVALGLWVKVEAYSAVEVSARG